MNDKAAKITAIIVLSLTTVITTICLINPIYLIYLLFIIMGGFAVYMICALVYMSIDEYLDYSDYRKRCEKELERIKKESKKD